MGPFSCQNDHRGGGVVVSEILARDSHSLHAEENKKLQEIVKLSKAIHPSYSI